MSERARVAIIDYEAGNLFSVQHACAQVGLDPVITADPAVLAGCAGAILPGVGAFGAAMANLSRLGLDQAIADFIATGRPFLGVCLGLQMLFGTTEEGPTMCLGAVAGNVRKFSDEQLVPAAGERLKVPHMGWSPVAQSRAHPLWAGIDDGARFYFAHSYYPVPDDGGIVVGTTSYPVPFTCAIARANIFAVQFHPEKSQRAGLRLLANFIAWDGNG
jgi:glutamine amidotransferase